MKCTFFHPIAFETWQPDTPDTRGIGGSETSQIELCWRLARRGHEVISYAPVPWKGVQEWRGSLWAPLEEVDWSRPGIWFLYRCPDALDNFANPHPGQQTWLVSQDEHYDTWNPERCAKLDRFIALCQTHAESHRRSYADLKDKVCVSSNGIKVDLIREIEAAQTTVRKYCFDWGGSLERNESLRGHARLLYAAGHEVHLVPALGRGYEADYAEQMRTIKVPFTAIHRVFDASTPQETAANKLTVLKQLQAEAFYDDNLFNIQAARDAGIRSVLVGAEPIPPEEIPSCQATRRNPHKMIYASSPDRGLHALLKIFKRLREWVSDAELHVFYGFDNIDKLISLNPAWASYKGLKEQILKLADQPGVIWRGRVNQRDLIREWFSAGIWGNPSLFTETSCITCMDAQACGAIPVCTPIWAVGENVMHGIFVQGDCYNDPLIQARFVGEMYRLMSNPRLQDEIRPQMMKDARERFNWERIVDQLESWMYGFEDHPLAISQFAFQLKHATGRILNVGCADDPADFKRRGAINLDLRTEDPIFHKPTKADIIADVRNLPLNGDRFSTVILGDILEHFQATEVPAILKKCKEALEPDGKIVITVPDDHRPVDQQHCGSDGSQHYTDGVCACHDHRIPEEMIRGWLDEAGLKPVLLHEIDYTHFVGHGVVAVPC